MELNERNPILHALIKSCNFLFLSFLALLERETESIQFLKGYNQKKTLTVICSMAIKVFLKSVRFCNSWSG